MLDTYISSYIIRRRPPSLIQRFDVHSEQLCVSVITAAELRFGAEKAGRPKLSDLVEPSRATHVTNNLRHFAVVHSLKSRNGSDIPQREIGG